MDRESLLAFVDGLEIPDGAKGRLRALTPATYLGNATTQAQEIARETLRRNAEILRSHPEILVEIQGNCDDRGSEEYNLALGERRARAAKDYLVNSGIGRQRISTVSFGESNPAAMGQSERAWQLNRRDDLVPKR
jgi:peptidoglycan-associated lipoprotein